MGSLNKTRVSSGGKQPKFVEIPAIPLPEEGGRSASSTFNRSRGGAQYSPNLEEDEQSLMSKLNLLLREPKANHVKTTSYPHPMLSHNSIKIHNNDAKQQQTISPASTLSDKGIGSSVGSFDSEFRQGGSLFLHRPLPYNTCYTGSLDSRTQDVSSMNAAPAHSRSSSDIICSSGTTSVSQSKLAEQCSAPLWNTDPRRGNKALSAPAVRPRRLSTRRQKSQRISSMERDADVKKLPQLCRDSPNRSTRSSVSSSHSITPATSVCEIATNKPKINIYSSEPLPPPPVPPPENSSETNNHLSPSRQQDKAPPLPPKNSQLQAESRHLTNPRSQQEDSVSSYHARSLSGQRIGSHAAYSDGATASTLTSTNHGRMSLDSGMGTMPGGKSHQNNSMPGFNNIWSKDARREVPVSLSYGKPMSLSKSLGSNLALGRAESTGVLFVNGENRVKSKLHGSTSALLQAGHSRSSSLASNDQQMNPCHDAFRRLNNSRSSLRSNPGEKTNPDPKVTVRFAPYRPPEVNLQSLHFELPLAVTSEVKFVGREWLFNEILLALTGKDPKNNKGVIISGAAGFGKTAFVQHLVSQSYHGLRNSRNNSRNDLDSIHRVQNSMSRSSSPFSRHGLPSGLESNNSSRTVSPVLGNIVHSRTSSQVSLTEDSSRKLASQVVAFHFCQSDNNTTCYVPEFLHSVAAQLSQAPQLTAYRELLITEPHLQNLLSVKNCIENPYKALRKAILEPLIMLKQSQKLPRSNLVIMVDGLSEAELYRPDYGFSILSFLQLYLSEFPDFIKIVATCRSEDRTFVSDFPVHFMSLDSDNTQVVRDMQLYVSQRIATSNALENLSLTGKSDTSAAQKQLSQHLLKLADGNFLYLRIILDLVEQRAIILKSSGFKVIPVNMHEVFLLQCNLRFMSNTTFDGVRDILAVVLASLYPLKDEQLYQTICSGLPSNHQMSWDDFQQKLELLEIIFDQNNLASGRTFFHPCLRTWLIDPSMFAPSTGTLQSSCKFKIDVKRGHTLLATILSRQPAERLQKHATLELAHHVLKAGMFKNQARQTGVSASENNARFMANSSRQLTDALSTTRNLFFPNLKVSRLLLRAGADPNVQTQIFSNASPLAIASHTGCCELVELLLNFGADVNLPASNGMYALSFAAAAGHARVVEILLCYRPALNQMDQNGHTPLLHAIARGHSNVAKLLLSRDLYQSIEHYAFAAQQSLVAASTTGDLELMRHLLDNEDFNCDVNGVEPMQGGESPLTSAAAHGKSHVCEFLICQYKANLNVRNKTGLTPLLCAVKQGEWDSADLLLNCGASIEVSDRSGKTPLMMAAYHGHLGVLELLLSRGAAVQAEDREGLTALGWSALQGHLHCARSLIGRSEVDHRDVNGRTALHLAAFYGALGIVDLLLDAGSDIDHLDATNGMSALDRAIGCQNTAVVAKLIRRGAKILPTSWAMAVGKPDVTTVLVDKSLEEGNYAYKVSDFDNAREIYARSLEHLGELPLCDNKHVSHGKLADICANLLLGYSRCLRKLGDLDEAVSTASRALELKPHWYEALYARARVLRELSRFKSALHDVVEAEQTAPSHNLKEIRRLIDKIKEEITTGNSRYSRPSSASSEIIPVPRPRSSLNSSSSYHGNQGHGTSSPAMSPDMSRSINGHHHGYRRNHLLGNDVHRVNSHESLSESMMSLTSFPSEIEHHRGSVRRVPRTNPHWRSHASELPRSVSVDDRNHIQSYCDEDKMSLCSERNGYSMSGGFAPMRRDMCRTPCVTDL